MNISEYHRKLFQKDKEALPVNIVPSNHTLSQYRGCRFFSEKELAACMVPRRRLGTSEPRLMRRAAFVACLYCEMLFDQAVYTHFQPHHEAYTGTWGASLKFGYMGTGPHILHPNVFLEKTVPGFIADPFQLEMAVPEAARLYAERFATGPVRAGALFEVLNRDKGRVDGWAYRAVCESLKRGA